MISTEYGRQLWMEYMDKGLLLEPHKIFIFHYDAPLGKMPVCERTVAKLGDDRRYTHYRWEQHCTRCWDLSTFATIYCKFCGEHFCTWCIRMHQFLDRAHERNMGVKA